MVAHCPDDAPLRKAIAGCGHTPVEHVLLLLHYDLASGNWQRGNGRLADRPKPLDCLLPPDMRTTQTIGGGARMTLDEAADFLGWELPTSNAGGGAGGR